MSPSSYMKQSLKPVKNILQGDSDTRSLIRQAKEDAARLAKIRQQLPPDVVHHCTGVHQRGSTVVLYADSPAWASRMRFAARTLTQQLDIGQVIIRVVPPTPAAKNRKKAIPPRRSEAAAEFLDHSADCCDDPQIQNRLRRIAKAMRHKNK